MWLFTWAACCTCSGSAIVNVVLVVVAQGLLLRSTTAFPELSSNLTYINRHFFPAWWGMRGTAQRVSFSSSRCLKHGVLASCDRRTPMLYAFSSRSSLCCNTMFSFSSVVTTSQSTTALLNPSRIRVTVWYHAWILCYFCFRCRNLPPNVDIKLLT